MQFRHPWYNALLYLEKKYGKFAWPDLLRYIAVFQCLVVLLNFVVTSLPDTKDFASSLTLDFSMVAKGQIWRLFTFILMPTFGTGGVFWILFLVFYVMFTWMLNDGLEKAWGSFRLTLYVVGIWLGLILTTAILSFLVGPAQAGLIIGFSAPGIIFSCALFAFAWYYPDTTVMLALVIPVKIKWIAFLDAAILVAIAFSTFGLGFLFLLPSMLPFFIVFLPIFFHHLQQRSLAKARREEYDLAKVNPDDVFHSCAKCGKTDQSDPHAEFAVEDDDEEYCMDCIDSAV